MSNKSENILGFIDTDTGRKPIPTLDHIYLNYTFQNKKNWETLRGIINIVYNAYTQSQQEDNIDPIECNINVITQFPYYKNMETTKPKEQDFRIESETRIDYIDFQNSTHPNIPIKERSIEYFAFSIIREKEKQVAHVWLLDGARTELLQGNIFSNYTIFDRVNRHFHPNKANILYVDLKSLSQTDTQAGELASVLVGTLKTPKDPQVALILQNLESSFNEFKNDTEAHNIMTTSEYLIAEGRAEGRAELLPQIAEKEERIKELEAQLAKKTN